MGTLVVAVSGSSGERSVTVLTSLRLLRVESREVLNETKLLASHNGDNADHGLAYLSAPFSATINLSSYLNTQEEETHVPLSSRHTVLVNNRHTDGSAAVSQNGQRRVICDIRRRTREAHAGRPVQCWTRAPRLLGRDLNGIVVISLLVVHVCDCLRTLCSLGAVLARSQSLGMSVVKLELMSLS